MWNPEKGECIQNLVVEQDAIGLFAMKSKPYLVAYSKLMDFYRMRTNSKADLQSEMVMTGKGQRNVLTRGEIPISRLISTFFSEYYSALVVVTSQ
jgi:DNA-directed RNA polymerase subunit E'/Rpb7